MYQTKYNKGTQPLVDEIVSGSYCKRRNASRNQNSPERNDKDIQQPSSGEGVKDNWYETLMKYHEHKVNIKP